MTPTTRFQACSISKPIAALGMLRLVDRGILDLDADINESLTSWRVPRNSEWQPVVTLRQLVSHSAGLTTSGFPGYKRSDALPSTVEILNGVHPANTFGVRVDTIPGSQFRYSGGGTLAMQQLLEDVTRTPFPELMQELVLEPQGWWTATTRSLPRTRSTTGLRTDTTTLATPSKAVGTSIPSWRPRGCGRRRRISAATRSPSRQRTPGNRAR